MQIHTAVGNLKANVTAPIPIIDRSNWTFEDDPRV
jgi:hypothetical protein